jgi:Na+-driven multidrug efflux pump
MALALSRAARLGPAASAAMEIGRTTWWTVGVSWWPISGAVAAIVSIAVAEHSKPRRIRAIASMAVAVTTALGLVGAVLVFAQAHSIPLLFLRDPLFLAPATASLRALAPLLTVSAVMDVTDAILISGGDGVRITAATAVATSVCVARLLTMNPADVTVQGIWSALLTAYTLRTLANMLRLKELYGGRKGGRSGHTNKGDPSTTRHPRPMH